MKKSYVAALAMAAAAILIAGALIRPRPALKPAPAVAQPAQSRRGQMRQISDFLAERASSSAIHVSWVHSSQASGVRWPDGQIVVSAAPPALVGRASIVTDAQSAPVSLAPGDRFTQAGWIVVVGRNANNEAITTSGILGGVADTNCDSIKVRKLLFNTSLDAAFAGGGVFDLSGDLLGLVIRCGSSWTAITHDSVASLLGQQAGTEAVAWLELGIHTRDPKPAERQIMRLPSGGLFASEVRRTSRAFNIGIRPGDLLVRTGNEPLARTEDLLALGKTVTLVRNGRRFTLSVDPTYTLEPPARSPTLTSVQPGTRLHAAGLRAGDRIVRANGLEEPGPSDLNRMLAGTRPVWLVYEREDRRVWVMLP